MSLQREAKKTFVKILATYKLDPPRHLPGKHPVLKLIQKVGQDANLVKKRAVDPLEIVGHFWAYDNQKHFYDQRGT